MTEGRSSSRGTLELMDRVTIAAVDELATTSASTDPAAALLLIESDSPGRAAAAAEFRRGRSLHREAGASDPSTGRPDPHGGRMGCARFDG